MIVTPKKEKAKLRFRISFVILFVAASFAACFVLYMKEDSPIEIEAPSSPVQSDGTEASESVSSAGINPVAENSSAVGADYLNKCLFAGGETVRSFVSEGIISSENAVYAVVSEDEENSFGLEAAAEVISERSAEYIYIFPQLEFSENAVGYISDYREFAMSAADANPDAAIYMVSVFPVSSENEADILNTEIDRFNSEMLRFCNETGIYYLDVNTALKGSDGKLSAEYIVYGVPVQSEICAAAEKYILSHTVG